MGTYGQKIILSDFKRQQEQRKYEAERRKKTWFGKLKEVISLKFFNLFLNTSSIHGLNHLTQKERHLLEILLWLVIIILALTGVIVLSSDTWRRYQESPTVISMDRDMYAWNTTFPCVTICPHTKLDQSRVDLYIRQQGIKDKDEFNSFINSLSIANYSNFRNVTPYPAIESKDYLPLLLNLSFQFNPGLSIGTSGVHLHLQQTLTESGLCYTINSQLAYYSSPTYMEANRWDIVKGNETFYVHPLDGEIFAQVINLSTGYDIYVHGPLEVPDISTQRHSSEDGNYMKLYVVAVAIYTSPEAASLNPNQRKCRFHKESNLRFSPVYSYNLCRIECRISLCLKYCGCMPYFYRSRGRTGKVKVCDVQGMRCLAEWEETLITLLDPKTGKKTCECQPNCDDVNYVTQSISSQPWFLGTNFQWGMVSYPKLRYRREIIFGFTDVLVYVGGMAGLFLGCSVLSFMEIIYFFTLRLFWYMVDQRKEKKTPPKQQQTILAPGQYYK